MKNLKIFIIALATNLLLGCGACKAQETTNQSETAESSNDVDTIEQIFQKSMKDIETTKYHEFIDPQSGLVQARFPIPKSWKVNHIDNPIYIKGLNNLRVYKTETSQYTWSNDPMMQQTLQMSGQMLARPMNIRQVLSQFLQPNIEAQGYKFLKSYDLPEVSGFWQRLFNAMPNTGTQRQVEALGTEWKTPKGTKSLIVLVRYQFTKQQTILWNIQTTELETEPGYFEKAKNAYFYSAANAQINPQWIQYANGQLMGNIRKTNEFWREASAQSAAAHNQRMNAIATRGKTATSIGDTYSNILDISHKGYLTRSNIDDSGHSKTVRAIQGTNLIGNHETGEHYSVPSGSNYYWVSKDGIYFGTDNALFNPNTDRQMRDKDWTKFVVEQ